MGTLTDQEILQNMEFGAKSFSGRTQVKTSVPSVGPYPLVLSSISHSVGRNILQHLPLSPALLISLLLPVAEFVSFQQSFHSTLKTR